MPVDNIEFLAHADTPLGLIILRRRELLSEPGTVVTEITLDHQLLMSSYYTASERELSRVALEMHGGEALRVLVGGLGLGYTAWEVLKSPRVEHAEVVEFLPAVVEWTKDGRVPLSGDLNGEERIEIVQGDVYARLDAAPKPGTAEYDLILIDVDHSPDEHLGGGNAGFYTAEGLRRAKEHLAPEGVLAVWSYAESSPFADAMGEVFAEVRVESVTYKNEMVGGEECTDWLFFGRDRSR